MTRNARIAVPPLLAVAVIAAGCARDLGATPEPTRPAFSVPPMETIPPSNDGVTGEVPADILEPILADAAERAGTPVDAIEIVTAAQKTFSDGSLDCPEPGMLYTQALVDGYHVVLDADGTQLDYRVTADGGFRLCEHGRPGDG